MFFTMWHCKGLLKRNTVCPHHSRWNKHLTLVYILIYGWQRPLPWGLLQHSSFPRSLNAETKSHKRCSGQNEYIAYAQVNCTQQFASRGVKSINTLAQLQPGFKQTPWEYFRVSLSLKANMHTHAENEGQKIQCTYQFRFPLSLSSSALGVQRQDLACLHACRAGVTQPCSSILREKFDYPVKQPFLPYIKVIFQPCVSFPQRPGSQICFCSLDSLNLDA